MIKMTRRIAAALLAVIVLLGTSCAYAGSSSDEMIITMTGDLMCETMYQQDLYDEEDGSYHFDQTFKYVQKYFDESDFTVGNLETCVAPGKIMSIDLRYKDDKPYMNAPEEYLRALKRAGFDGLILANNHTLDTGISGLRKTIKAVREEGFKQTGLYLSKKSKHYFILQKNDIRVAFLGYATYYNNRDHKLTKAKQKKYLSKFSEKRLKADIKAAKKAGANYIVAYMHAGTENTYNVNDRQKKIARIMAKNGVDFIVGSHPHCLQKKGIIKYKGRKVPVVYSMGNFTGKLKRDLTRETALVRITLKKNANGKVSLKNRKFIPVFMADRWEGEKMVLIPEGYKAKNMDDQKTLDDHFTHIRDILNDDL